MGVLDGTGVLVCVGAGVLEGAGVAVAAGVFVASGSVALGTALVPVTPRVGEAGAVPVTTAWVGLFVEPGSGLAAGREVAPGVAARASVALGAALAMGEVGCPAAVAGGVVPARAEVAVLAGAVPGAGVAVDGVR